MRGLKAEDARNKVGIYTEGTEFAEDMKRRNGELRMESEITLSEQRRASSYVVLPRSIEGL
jgi:hypothetical protein